MQCCRKALLLVPFGFESGSNIPVYHELYPNALKEVSEGVSGYLYEVFAEENQVIPFKNIPCARLATEPVRVTNCVRVENAYDLFKDYVKQGKMKTGYFIKLKLPQVWERYIAE